jgi:alpha-galactosidase
MELCSQASFSDAHECKSIPIIAANVQRMIKPSQSQIWAVLSKEDDIHRVNYSLTAGFLGRLCLSGEIFDIPDENWQITLEAIKLYGEITPIIKDGYTRIIECTAEDYNDPTGYQIVLRELGDKALMIVHTFKDGANPPIDKYLDDYKIAKAFGSDLDGEFRGKAYLLEK